MRVSTHRRPFKCRSRIAVAVDPPIKWQGKPPTRRRFLAVAAAALTACGPAQATTPPIKQHISWRGVALGAEVEIGLVHPDVDLGRKTLVDCVQEIRRLERIFSLYDSQSTLSRLNRAGRIAGPEHELVELLATAVQFTQETGGAFDVSVQRLWATFAQHFSTPGASPNGPARAIVQSTLNLVGSQHIHLSPQEIVLERNGMALTFNGIAQGYITDKIRGLLNARGFGDVLIDLGEVFAGGTRPNGDAWQVGIAGGGSPATIVKRLRLQDRALATSSGAGYTFSPDSRFTHLIDPRTGQSQQLYKSVSVIADDAATADALSTSFAVLPLQEIERITRKRARISVSLHQLDGTVMSFPRA